MSDHAQPIYSLIPTAFPAPNVDMTTAYIWLSSSVHDPFQWSVLKVLTRLFILVLTLLITYMFPHLKNQLKIIIFQALLNKEIH